MTIKKFRWSQVYESSEEELLDFMQARNIVGERIHATADETPIQQRIESDKRIWCAEGSLVVKTESAQISMQPGDAVRLEASTTYTIIPGFADCVYYLSN